MFCVLYLPVFSEKDNIVLPERGREGSLTDPPIIIENGGKIVGLKVIDLLTCDKIHWIGPKQCGHQLFAMFPGVGPIFCQTETKVEGHYGEVIDVGAHNGMKIMENWMVCQII